MTAVANAHSNNGAALGRRSSTPMLPLSSNGLADLQTTLDRVAGKISPVWPLKDFVAVNPYLGLSDCEWLAARRRLRSFSNSETLMPLAYYADQYRRGEITLADVEAAIDEMSTDGVDGVDDLSSAAVAAALVGAYGSKGTETPRRPPIQTLSEVVDRSTDSAWSGIIREEIGKHCAAHYDEGHAAWASPWKRLSLFQAWRSSALVDRRVEVLGLSKFRRFVSLLPHEPEEAIAWLLGRLEVPRILWEAFLLSEAFSVLGWSSWTRYQVDQASRRGEKRDDFIGLLAIRLAYDVAVAEGLGVEADWQPLAESWDVIGGSLADATDHANDQALLRCCLLRASEIAYRRKLLGRIAVGSQVDAESTASPKPPGTKLAQLVFCIDVRSERMRRALESCSPDLETFGFAGFFGVPMEYVPWGEATGSSHVPAPLDPKFQVHEGPAPCAHSADKTSLERRRGTRTLRKVGKSFQVSAISGFACVETSGWWYGLRTLARALGFGGGQSSEKFDGVAEAERSSFGPQLTGLADQGLDVSRQADLAQTVLRNLGLVEGFARLVVFCGHGSQSANNPLQAGLDCGACCGHTGEASARFAAALLNRPEIRRELAERGLSIPAEAFFMAALHNTTTDELQFFDASQVPPSHQEDFQMLRTHVRAATKRTLTERMPALHCDSEGEVLQRSVDWSEVRPEWGLAGNAAFVVGPRSLTADGRLEGRTFLHNYDYRLDPDGVVLELIMTAPMVVTHWINMQYYASVVDNERFGSGSKTIHNVVGQFGLFAGGGGDLLTGLPWQSLHDGTRLQHEPLRLQVLIAAPRAAIHRVVEKHALVKNLIVNGWLHLAAIEEGQVFRYTPGQQWLPLPVDSAASSAPFDAKPEAIPVQRPVKPAAAAVRRNSHEAPPVALMA